MSDSITVDLTGDTDDDDEPAVIKVTNLKSSQSSAKKSAGLKPTVRSRSSLSKPSFSAGVKPTASMVGLSRKRPANSQSTLFQSWNPEKTSKTTSEDVVTEEETSPSKSADDDKTDSLIRKNPYYWKIVTRMINHTLQDTFEGRYIKDSHRKKLLFFLQLDEPEQHLAVRLFLRKHSWLRRQSLKYPDISSNIPKVLDSLQSQRIIVGPSDDVEISELLEMLRAPELQAVASKFKLGKKTVLVLKNELIDLTRKKDMFGGSINSLPAKIKETCMPYVSECFRLAHWFIEALNSVCFVYTMFTPSLLDEDIFAGNTLIWRLFESNQKPAVFEINRDIQLFNQPQFETYFELHKLMNNLNQIMKNKDFTKVITLLQKCWKTYNSEFMSSETIRQSDDFNRPRYLRRYSPQSVMNKLKFIEVECFCKLKQYDKAALCIQVLLSSEFKSGELVEKLALIYSSHLNNKEKSMEILQKGLTDEKIPVVNLLPLSYRAHGFIDKATEKSKQSKKVAPKLCWDCDLVSKKCCQILEKFSQDNITRKNLFATKAPNVNKNQSLRFIYKPANRNGTFMCSVEEYVLAHYKEHEDFSNGLHREGGLFKVLFFALMADIIFSNDVPNVFFSENQPDPLDWRTPDFSRNREKLLTKRYSEIESSFKRQTLIMDNHLKYPNVVDWSMFETVGDICDILNCFRATQIAQIFNGILEDCSFSGMPDLTLWSRVRDKVKLCEVKAPGDKLANKQIIWLQRLREMEVDAEVVYVSCNEN